MTVCRLDRFEDVGGLWGQATQLPNSSKPDPIRMRVIRGLSSLIPNPILFIDRSNHVI